MGWYNYWLQSQLDFHSEKKPFQNGRVSYLLENYTKLLFFLKAALMLHFSLHRRFCFISGICFGIIANSKELIKILNNYCITKINERTMKEANKNLVIRLKNNSFIPAIIAFNLLLILSFIMVIVFTLRHSI